MTDVDVAIIGGGPAGTATALSIANSATPRQLSTTIIEERSLPRPKVCGGGITRTAQSILRELDAPYSHDFEVQRATLYTTSSNTTVRRKNLFHIVDRERFDNHLLQHAQARGITLLTGEKVLRCNRIAGRWEVITSARKISASVIVCASGANSSISQTLTPPPPRRMRAIEAIGSFPSVDPTWASFDFRLPAGLAGYSWNFPVLHANRYCRAIGIGLTPRLSTIPVSSLREELEFHLPELRSAELKWISAPSNWFDPRISCGADGLLLAGDALGTDPYLGEGISSALWSGKLAGEAIVETEGRGPASFREYEKRLSSSVLGKTLAHRLRFADRYQRGLTRRDVAQEWLTFKCRLALAATRGPKL